MNWGAASALGAWTIIVGGAMVFVVRVVAREEIAKLNGTYKRTAEYILRDQEIERRLEHLEAAPVYGPHRR